MAKTIAGAFAAMAAAAMLTGCGGSSADPASVADTLGCTTVVDTTSSELFVQKLQTCTLPAGQASIYSFASSDDADGWYDVAKEFVGEGKLFRVGDTVIVSADDTTVAAAVSSALG